MRLVYCLPQRTHQEASLSLVVCNTVAVAQRVYAAIRDTFAGASDVVLLTSHFRAGDRKENEGKLLAFAKQPANTP